MGKWESGWDYSTLAQLREVATQGYLTQYNYGQRVVFNAANVRTSSKSLSMASLLPDSQYSTGTCSEVAWGGTYTANFISHLSSELCPVEGNDSVCSHHVWFHWEPNYVPSPNTSPTCAYQKPIVHMGFPFIAIECSTKLYSFQPEKTFKATRP